jgi:very-short-patch-repair endonuclease
MPHSPVSDRQRNRAKSLRQGMTRAETLLWRHLKANRLASIGFRQQVPMKNYIADFMSHSTRLIVELNDESHDFAARQSTDKARDAWFESQGYLVLRFTNNDVLQNLDGVARAIIEAASSRHASPLLPSLPHKGGGNPQSNG